MHGELAYNFIPFLGLLDEWNTLFPIHLSSLTGNLLGNIIAFIPLGFFITFWIRRPSLLFVMFYSIMFSIVIELLQLLFFIGVCDINDVILNGIGGGIGYFIAKYLKSILKD